MARRTATSYRTSKTTVTTSGEAETPDAVPAEEGKGMTFVDAISITTMLLLLAAILMTDYFLGKRYGTGIFFS
jgi:hypothetical protein